MRKFGCLPSLLIVSGFLSVLAITWPVLIVVGLFIFLVPGLVLAASPTVFVYLSFFSLGWYGVKQFGTPARAFAGLAMAGMIGIIPATIANFRSTEAIAKIKSTSIHPSKPVYLPDNITILQPSYSLRYSNIDSYETNCDDLCLALLYGGTVKTVTMGTSQLDGYLKNERGNLPAITYSISQNEKCKPQNSKQLAHWSGWKDDESMARLLFAVSVRIAKGDCLIAQRSTAAVSRLQLIFLESPIRGSVEGKPHDPKVRILEIKDKGILVARSVDVEATELSTPTWLSPEGYGLEISSWHLARRTYLKAEPINSVARLRLLTGWPIPFPATEIKGAS